MMDGEFTLTITFPRSSPALTAATLKLDGMAFPLGIIVVVTLGVVVVVTLGVVAAGVDGVVIAGGVVILGAVMVGLELVDVLGVENDGAVIVGTFGSNGMAL